MNKFLAGVNRIKRLEKKSKIRHSEEQIFEKLNAEFPVKSILDKYNTSIAYVTNIIKESRKNSIYQRSGSFDTLADSAQAVMAVLGKVRATYHHKQAYFHGSILRSTAGRPLFSHNSSTKR